MNNGLIKTWAAKISTAFLEIVTTRDGCQTFLEAGDATTHGGNVNNHEAPSESGYNQLC